MTLLLTESDVRALLTMPMALEAVEELRVDLLNLVNHRADDNSGFTGGVGGRAHTPKTV